MITRRLVLFGALLAVGQPACEVSNIPRWRGVVGTVHEAAFCTAGVDEAPTTVPKAQLRVHCPPDTKDVYTVEADSEGVFSVSDPPRVDGNCLVQIEAPGFIPRTYRVADLCGVDDGEGCAQFAVSAWLIPEPPP